MKIHTLVDIAIEARCFIMPQMALPFNELPLQGDKEALDYMMEVIRINNLPAACLEEPIIQVCWTSDDPAAIDPQDFQGIQADIYSLGKPKTLGTVYLKYVPYCILKGMVEGCTFTYKVPIYKDDESAVILNLQASCQQKVRSADHITFDQALAEVTKEFHDRWAIPPGRYCPFG